MGTITARKRRGGGTGYTAQIRIKRGGEVVHSESATFERRASAAEWMRRREAELDEQRSRGEPIGQRQTVADLLDWYDRVVKPLTPWGRSKSADLARLRGYDIAKRVAARLTTQDFIAHVEGRRKGGAGAATAGNDLVWLRQVLRSARASLGISINMQALDDATHELRQRGVVAKAKARDRRLKPDEESRLLEFFSRRDKRAQIPMADVMRFALASARRQEEITRLLWPDLDRAANTAKLRDVKHPRRKIGNHRDFRVLREAWEIIERQPRSKKELRIFPYDAKSIGAAFTRACRVLEIEDLRFHDLRHEATSRLFERGYSIQEVAQFTLHESWATLKRYTHLRPRDVPER